MQLYCEKYKNIFLHFLLPMYQQNAILTAIFSTIIMMVIFLFMIKLADAWAFHESAPTKKKQSGQKNE